MFDLDGNELDGSRLDLGQRVVVVLTVAAEPDANYRARLMVDAPLPAGLVIDNPNLLSGAEAGNLEWLSLSQEVANAEFRADRFLAALDFPGDGVVSVGYMARAVAPGDYAYPAAIVEDMYRPYMRARTASGRMTVDGPVR
jgi:uncharacterized protein YfaS (alpha-2-macroglobulin family)